MTLVASHVVRTLSPPPPPPHPEEWLTICLESGHRFNILGETLSGVGPPSCHRVRQSYIQFSVIWIISPPVCVLLVFSICM